MIGHRIVTRTLDRDNLLPDPVKASSQPRGAPQPEIRDLGPKIGRSSECEPWKRVEEAQGGTGREDEDFPRCLCQRLEANERHDHANHSPPRRPQASSSPIPVRDPESNEAPPPANSSGGRWD